jgi:type I restriction-modification system DNA methylase subunit
MPIAGARGQKANERLPNASSAKREGAWFSTRHITLEGQEKDVTTAGLARMNMILHDFPTANVLSGNTLFDPKFKDGEQLRTYDYVVANPPFSDKTWSTGLTPGQDRFQRFTWGVPPKKQGDYASKGFKKDGPKNRLREQDIQRAWPRLSRRGTLSQLR